jgi:Uma2 family endonuclease
MPVMTLAQPQPRRWTREEYLRMSDLGFFQGHRVERIDWEIVETPAQKNPHATAVTRTLRAVDRVFGQTHSVRVGATLAVGPGSDPDPDPDLAVIDWAVQQRSDPPDAAVLVIEVSDTTLRYDLGRKANLYASGDVPDYWVLDVNGRQVHVHRHAVADPSTPFGYRYSSVVVFAATGAASPLAAPHASIAVADMLP